MFSCVIYSLNDSIESLNWISRNNNVKLYVEEANTSVNLQFNDNTFTHQLLWNFNEIAYNRKTNSEGTWSNLWSFPATILLKKTMPSASTTTSSSGSINTGIAIASYTVISAIVVSGAYPNGLYADIVTSNNTYWLIVKQPGGNLITNQAVACYIYYTSK